MQFSRMLPDKLPMPPVVQAALGCFAVNGYHGTTIRQIATAAGLSVPGVYHYFPSKHDILVSICDVAMTELLGASERAIAEAGDSLLDRYDALVECLVQFHADFADVAFVSFSEIRSLQGEARERHLDHRRQQQDLIYDLVDQGVAAGIFATPDSHHVARAVSSICLGISRWYRPDGVMTLDEVCEVHVRICRNTALWIGERR